ncbi:hypothetical protein LOTGIDRAFT_231485 [Lottia gigantea]|uniref:PRKR-interacting protein 1 homolog n=1 Tax=Lottia gigantea TaxID=225164 RepID=V4AU24_LOTGI|nr:hypothetical protein LOTGIDRAFT_231485 [Lottia gigantea]ESO97276.1 hypothetical protein LOTGIDRAFT_231485 [Lottia gigantea]
MAAKSDKKVIVVSKTSDLQRLKLEKLMKNPDKEVFIPEKSKDPSAKKAPEFIRNVWGSSAGAGSGDFHVYRGVRRREYARQKFNNEKAKREELDEEFKAKVSKIKETEETKAAKKRAKRLKKKQRQKDAKKRKKEGKEEDSESEEEEEEEEEEENEEEKNQDTRNHPDQDSQNVENVKTENDCSDKKTISETENSHNT